MGFLDGLASAFSVSDTSSITHITKNITKNIHESCGNNDLVSATEQNISLNVTGVDCADINLITQTVQAKTSCAMTSATKALTSGIKGQLQSAAKEAGKPVTMNLFGVNISSSDKTISTTVKDTFKSKCGDGNSDIQNISNVTIDLTGVSCDDLNVLTQQSSVSTICSVKMLHSVLKSNPHIANAAVPGSSNTHAYIAWGASAAVFIVICCIVAGLIIRARRHGKVAQAAAQLNKTNQTLDSILKGMNVSKTTT